MARRTIESIVLVPFMMAILAGAGALILAMVFALCTMDLDGLMRAAGTMLEGIFLHGLVFGLGAGLLGGAITLFVDRGSALPIAAAAGFLVFCGYGLYSVVAAALVASPVGGTIGGVIGGLLGVPVGLYTAREGARPGRKQTPPDRPAGDYAADVDYWQADLPDGD